MLQAMRDKVMGVLGWVIIGLIIVTFALFGLGSYMQDKSRVYAAKVNDSEITPRELQMAYQQQRSQMEEMLGEAYDPAMIDDKLLRKRALEGLITQRLLLETAEANGMAISDQLLAAYIHSAPVFQDDGSFSEDRYQRLLYQQGQTPAGFEHSTRQRLIVEQFINGLSQTAFVTDGELAQAYRLQEQKRDFSYWVVAAQSLQETIEPTEQQLRAYYDEHSEQFAVPERVRLAYVRLSADKLSEGIEADEAEIEAQYQARRSELKSKEQRRASHILIQVPQDAEQATIDAARNEAQGLLEQIRNGADFAELAREHSDDPGSAEKGGDLGFFAKGVMAPEFEQAVFSLKPGDVSELVRTQFGYHIIKLEAIQSGEVPSLDEMREQLAADVKRRAAEEVFYDQLDELTNITYESSDSLDAAAEVLGLEIQHSDWLNADGGPGIGGNAEVVSAAFSDDVLEAGHNSEPVELDTNDVVVVRVEEREPAQKLSFDEAREQVTREVRRQLAAEEARARGEALLAKLADGTQADQLKDFEDAVFHQASAVKRSVQDHNPEVVKKAFSLPRPTEGGSVDEGVALSNGDYAVIHLVGVSDGDPAAMTEQERAQIRQGYQNLRRSLTLSALVDDLRARADVELPEEQE
jgi:peptidyl-prolyl cis-trans isomerase D